MHALGITGNIVYARRRRATSLCGGIACSYIVQGLTIIRFRPDVEASRMTSRADDERNTVHIMLPGNPFQLKSQWLVLLFGFDFVRRWDCSDHAVLYTNFFFRFLSLSLSFYFSLSMCAVILYYAREYTYTYNARTSLN